ncbi:MAG: hypothetical protein ACRDQZ_02000 [Mycobacteriales bacterium]
MITDTEPLEEPTDRDFADTASETTPGKGRFPAAGPAEGASPDEPETRELAAEPEVSTPLDLRAEPSDAVADRVPGSASRCRYQVGLWVSVAVTLAGAVLVILSAASL